MASENSAKSVLHEWKNAMSISQTKPTQKFMKHGSTTRCFAFFFIFKHLKKKGFCNRQKK